MRSKRKKIPWMQHAVMKCLHQLVSEILRMKHNKICSLDICSFIKCHFFSFFKALHFYLLFRFVAFLFYLPIAYFTRALMHYFLKKYHILCILHEKFEELYLGKRENNHNTDHIYRT
ncbi:unnamed protein product [Onchocerca flexuosa]|uniref:Uncharacterized protein n=1 Tax=Onchocerca flexuosa TaxID=387005 RepID=A0A183HKU1_9BILA|nr:unnamed protein product [Onchocerca flexuosa]